MWSALLQVLLFTIVKVSSENINENQPCTAALGMESRTIPDRNINASSVYPDFFGTYFTRIHGAAYGRLHSRLTNNRAGAWDAATNDKNQWLQVDFGTEMVVSGVATQGRHDEDQWVTSYSLSYSLDGRTFYSYRDNKTFIANTDRNTVVKHTLPTTIVARYVRIHPRTWRKHISMRAEFYGCEKPAVSYYLQNKSNNNCDQTCQSHGQFCAAMHHGLRDDNVLKIFTKLLGIPCLTAGTNYIDLWRPVGPAFLNNTNSRFVRHCFGWKSIPKHINCRRIPQASTTRRLCPCVLVSEGNSLTSPAPLINFTETTPRFIATEKSTRPTEAPQIVQPNWSLKDRAVKELSVEDNNVSVNSVVIIWERPKAPCIGYIVLYKAIEVASVPVFNTTLHELVLNKSDYTRIQITDLESFTTYNITVTPIGRNGLQMTSRFILARTCRCPKELNAFWWLYPPYTIQNNQSAPTGIISEFLLRMVKDVCGVCPTHGETSIDFQRERVRTRRSFESFDTILPIGRFPGRLDFAGYSVTPMLEVPGFALIKTPKSKTFLFRAMSSSVFDSWPYFLIYYAMMTLAGIVYWFLERNSEPDQLPKSFSKGAQHGIWWSFVSMTTVGYGDLYPKSICGRIFAIAWFLLGIVINTLLISAISSSCTVKVLDELHVKPGKVVGTLIGSPAEYYLTVKKRTGGTAIHFQDLTTLAQSLQSGQLDSAILDVNVAAYTNDVFNDSWCTVSKVINFPFSFGIGTSNKVAKLETHFRIYTHENQARLLQLKQQQTIKKATNTSKENKDNTKETNENSPKETSTLPDNDALSPNVLFLTAIMYLGLMLGVFIVCGLIFQSLMTIKERKKTEKQGESVSAQYLNTKREMQMVVKEFRDNITRTYNALARKHLMERKKLLSMKKKDGTNLKTLFVSCPPKINPTTKFRSTNLSVNLDGSRESGINMHELSQSDYKYAISAAYISQLNVKKGL